MSWWQYAIAIWAAGAVAMLMYSLVQVHRVRYGDSELDQELKQSMEENDVTFNDLYQVSILSAIFWPYSAFVLAKGIR